jgi:hypothetical protein
LGSKQIDLMKEALVKEGVTLCETCAESKCINNGVCQEAYAEQGYKCICPSGYTGVNCEFQGEVCYPGMTNLQQNIIFQFLSVFCIYIAEICFSYNLIKEFNLQELLPVKSFLRA